MGKSLFKKDYIKELTAELLISKADLLGKIRELHPEKNFRDVFVVADEEDRYVIIAAYEVDYIYRGLRWTRLVGQLGGLFKVYSDGHSYRQNLLGSICLSLLLRL